jgi:hypothetical protein
MRSTIRRIQIGLGALTAASFLMFLAPVHASAGPCYRIGADPDGVLICPWQ